MKSLLFAVAGCLVVGSASAADPEPTTLKGHTDSVNAVAFSPDGTLLATGGSDDLVIIWDVATGKNQTTLKGHEDSVLGLAFSTDGKFLASAAADNTVRIWDLKTNMTLHVQGHTDQRRRLQL